VDFNEDSVQHRVSYTPAVQPRRFSMGVGDDTMTVVHNGAETDSLTGGNHGDGTKAIACMIWRLAAEDV
jgi:hypothetical protein